MTVPSFLRQFALTLVCVLTLRADYTTTITGSNSGGAVWGSGPYTDDSDFSKAAVHAGLISPGQTATIRIVSRGTQAGFVGSTSNGVTTSSYSSSWAAVDLELVSTSEANSAPSCSITGSTSLAPGEQGSWTYTASDEDSNLYRWRVSLAPNSAQWTYISGGSQSGTMTYSFASAGSYTFNLEVEDTSGERSSDSIIIHVGDTNNPPGVSISFSENPIESSTSLGITATASDQDSSSSLWLNSMSVRWQNHDLVGWWSVSGTSATRTATVTMPTAPGTQYFRGEVWDNANGQTAADWQAVVVVAPTNPSVAVLPTTPKLDQSISVSYSDAPDSSSWIGIYQVGASNYSYVASGTVTSPGSGTKTFIISTAFSVGTTYEARLFPSGSYSSIAVSNPFTVTAPDPTYTLTVLGGNGGASNLRPGNVVSITATPGAGQAFVRWSMYGAGLGSIGQGTSSTTTFTVGNSDATVQALYQGDPAHYLVSVEGGSATPAGPRPAGTVLTLTANPGVNQVFVNWVHANGLGLLTSPNQSPATFTMAEDNASVYAVFTGGDTQPPTAPTGLAISAVAATSLTLTWNASSDNIGITGYRVLQNGETVIATTSTSVTVGGLVSGVSYQFQVQAKDAAGNWSSASTAVNASTSMITPRVAVQYWRADDYPGIVTGYYQDVWHEGYWTEDYWSYDMWIDWDALNAGYSSWYSVDVYTPDGNFYTNTWNWYHYENWRLTDPAHWQPGYYSQEWVSGSAQPDGQYGSSWTTSVGTFNIGDGASSYTLANATRGSFTHSYATGQKITFKAWGSAPAGNCDSFQARLYAPNGGLLQQSGTFASGQGWKTDFTPSSSGVYRVEVGYSNATGGAEPPNGTATYYVPVGSLSTQTITFLTIADRYTTAASFQLSASASSGLPVTYSVISGPASVSGGTLTLSGATGVVTVRASQPGNAIWNVAAPVDRSFTVSVAPPTITVQPADRIISVGQTGIFSVSATGSGLSYKWQRKGYGAANFSDLSENLYYSGVATPALSVAGVDLAQNGDLFRCVVANASGNVLTTVATLQVQPAVVITSHPKPKTVFATGIALFEVVAVAPQPLLYQWQRMASGSATFSSLVDGGGYVGSSTRILKVTSSLAMSGDQFRCLVRTASAPAAVQSNAGLLTVLGGDPNADTDSDGVTDGVELEVGLDHQNAADAKVQRYRYDKTNQITNGPEGEYIKDQEGNIKRFIP